MTTLLEVYDKYDLDTLRQHIRELKKEDEGKRIVKVLPVRRKYTDCSYYFEKRTLEKVIQQSDQCRKCGCIDQNKIKYCEKCHIAQYCSKKCQVADFQEHKKQCAVLAENNYKGCTEYGTRALGGPCFISNGQFFQPPYSENWVVLCDLVKL